MDYIVITLFIGVNNLFTLMDYESFQCVYERNNSEIGLITGFEMEDMDPSFVIL
jgi:hypothetical protein